MREFMHSDDLASAVHFLLERYDDDLPINVGSGEEISIADLAVLVAQTVGFEGSIVFDRSKPDGTPRKKLDSTRLEELGWRPRKILTDGVGDAYRWFVESSLR